MPLMSCTVAERHAYLTLLIFQLCRKLKKLDPRVVGSGDEGDCRPATGIRYRTLFEGCAKAG